MVTYILYRLVNLYIGIIFVYVILSWFPRPYGGILYKIEQALATICEPYLGLFRKLIPPIGGMVDVSPILAVLVLELAVQLVARLLSYIF